MDKAKLWVWRCIWVVGATVMTPFVVAVGWSFADWKITLREGWNG